ncbi:MAG TPA: PsbP-related protein [Tepidisphaeraceae bacterium]|jgi:hypothetical protein
MAALRTFLITCGVILFLFPVSSVRCAEPSTAPALPNSAEDPDYHFSIRYPSSWILGKTPSSTMQLLVPAPGGKGGSLMITAYPITALPPGDLKTLEQVHDRDIRIAKAAGSNIVEEGDTKLGNMPAKVLVFSSQVKGQMRENQSIFALKDGIVYSFSFQASQEMYEQSADTVRAVADSFRLAK